MGVKGVKTLMIAGGGTGGHIYPAIAIAQEWQARDATRHVIFVGTERGLEKTIVPKAGFPLEFISVGGLKGKGGRRHCSKASSDCRSVSCRRSGSSAGIVRTSSSASAATRRVRCCSRPNCAAFRL